MTAEIFSSVGVGNGDDDMFIEDAEEEGNCGVSRFCGFEPGTNIALAIVMVTHHIPTTNQGSDTYEFIHCAGCMNSYVTGYMNSYFLMYDV